MNVPVRILIVEDKDTDAELARHEISKTIPDCAFQLVKTRKDFLEAIQTFQPDLILADYSLPSFNGRKALELALKHTPLTPLIIWTGTLSEDVAVECMKAGANNYILKENIKRLAPAVVHALEERRLQLERKQTEDALIKSERRFRALIEHGRDNISLLAADGTLLWESPATVRSLGYSQDKFVGHNIFELVHPDDLDWVSDLYAKLVHEPGSLQQGSFRLQHASGAWRWVEATVTNLLNEPSVNAIVVNYRDITERKEAEDALRESENRLILALAGARMSIWEWDLKTDRVLWSPEFFEITGTSQGGNNKTFESFTHLIHAEDAQRVKISAEKAIREKKLFAEEFRIVRPDGEIRWLSNLGHVDYDPKHLNLRMIGTIRDITDQKQAERALYESEQRYRALFEHSPISIWEEDFSEVKKYLDSLKEQGITNFHEYFSSHPGEVFKCAGMIRILDVNNTALLMYRAKSKQELIRSTFENLNQSEQEHNRDDFAAIAMGQTSRSWEGADETLTGEPLEISLSWSVAPGHEDDFSRVFVITTDITDRKRIDDALRDSEERFRLLFDRIKDGVYLSTHAGRFVDVNPAMIHMFGYASKEEMLAVDIKNELYFKPDERGSHLLDTGREETDIYRMRRKDGTEIWVEDHGSYIHDDDGNIIYHQGILRDITERKEAETALRERDELLRDSQRIARLGHYQLDIQTGIWESSDVLNEILGIDKSYLTDINGWIQFVHPEQRDEMLAYFTAHVLKEHNGFDREYRILRNNDGRERWVHGLGQLEFDEKGNLIRMIGTIQDITERKAVEDTLRTNQTLLQGILDSSADGILAVGTENKVLFTNDRFMELWMIPPEIAATKDDSILLQHVLDQLADPQAFIQSVQELYLSPEDSFDTLYFKDGRIFERLSQPMLNGRKIVGRVWIFRDVTERKQNEAKILRNVSELEALYENGLVVSQLLTPREIGERIIKTFAEYLSWHHVAIRLKRAESDLLDLIAFNKAGINEAEKDEMERRLSSMVSNLDEGLSGWVVQTGQSLRTGDVHAHPQYVITQAGIKSGLYMPLKVGKRVVGVISVESEQADAFSQNDERLLATLANQAAVAFENARLYQAVQQDLAERKRMETALRGSETHYRELADSITDVMFELDRRLHYTHWNKASEALTGVSKEKAIGRSMRDIFGESDEQTRIEKIYLDVLVNRRSKSFETILGANGGQRYFEINAYPSMRGVSVVAKDITERKKSETIMQKRFELMEYAAHHSLEDTAQKVADEVCILTGSAIAFLQIMQADQSTQSLYAWSTNTLELFDPAFREEHHLPVSQAGMWADALRHRRPIIHNDYESVPAKKGLPEGHAPIVREMVFPIIRREKIVAAIGVGNKPQDYTQQDLELAEGFVDYAWDITERKQMEVELAAERNQLTKRVEERTTDLIHANANLARALRVKDEFLANMSHELRTPLNAILGLSESLAEQIAGPLNDKQAKYINTISESGHHLLSLINDILDLAKIEAGQITLDISTVNISSVCQASLRMVKQQAQKKNQELMLEIDQNVDYIWADERRLKQMMVNLLSNAVKFTPDNGKIGLKVYGEQAENKVTITVWDNGIGISQNDLSRLFIPFMQLDSGLARESTGTGLGLVLVAQMVRLHGGSVTVESDPGAGSRFSIILPWEPALATITVEKLKNTGKLPALNPVSKNKYTILLIEDTQEVVMMMKDYLELAGYNVFTAQDGLEGIAQAKLTHPDLILMDVQMPRMNGLEATQKLRGEPEFKHTPIIALTALAMSSDRERCLAAGMDEYISKPINLKTLSKIIQGFLSSREESTPPR